MKFQHTPGPWHIEGRFQPPGSDQWGFIITHGTNRQGDGPEGKIGDLMVTEADARLISAAPELLTQLKGMLGLARFIINAADIDPEATTVVLRNRGETVAEVPISVLLTNTEAAITEAEGL